MQDPWEFYEKFTRSQPLLYSIAVAVLGGRELAEEVVQNCCRTASVSQQRFQQGNAFHSWLLRILIEEALVVLRQEEGFSAICNEKAA
jgi:DNA-directed RNA polymerase specialized sigma24 family protein